MEDKVKFLRVVSNIGGALKVNIPIEIAEYLDVKVGDKVELVADISEKGRFAAFWKKVE